MLPQICAVGQHILHWWGDVFPPSLFSPSLSPNVALSLPAAHTLNAAISCASRSGYFQCREEEKTVCIVCVDVHVCMFVCLLVSVLMMCAINLYLCLWCGKRKGKRQKGRSFHDRLVQFEKPWEEKTWKNLSDHKWASHRSIWVHSKGENTWRTVTIIPSTPES